jgi:hypothetical protein
MCTVVACGSQGSRSLTEPSSTLPSASAKTVGGVTSRSSTTKPSALSTWTASRPDGVLASTRGRGIAFGSSSPDDVTVAPRPFDGRATSCSTTRSLYEGSRSATIATSSRCSRNEAGVTYEELVGTLIVMMPIVGVARVVSAAPKLGLAIGYDVGVRAAGERGRQRLAAAVHRRGAGDTQGQGHARAVEDQQGLEGTEATVRNARRPAPPASVPPDHPTGCPPFGEHRGTAQGQGGLSA